MIDKKYLLKSSSNLARLSRLMAKGIDLFIVLILSMIHLQIGVMLAAVYIGLADCLYGGQSVGKKFIGFAVVSIEDGSPCTAKQSIIRNLPFLIPLCFMIFPIWGWILAILIGVPLILLELYLLFKLDSGNRLGDVMADTTVIANHPDLEKKKKGKTSGWFDAEKAMPLQRTKSNQNNSTLPVKIKPQTENG